MLRLSEALLTHMSGGQRVPSWDSHLEQLHMVSLGGLGSLTAWGLASQGKHLETQKELRGKEGQKLYHLL